MGAILVGRAVERAGGGKPGRGRHILGDDVGIAGNVTRQMAGKDAGIGVIAAAGAAADQHGDRFVSVEFFDRLRPRTRRPSRGHE
jgi:hypothetical protein